MTRDDGVSLRNRLGLCPRYRRFSVVRCIRICSRPLTPGAPFQVDLSSRPIDVDYTPARGLGVFFLIFGAVFSAFSLMALTEQGGIIKYLIGGGILLIGLMIVRLGLRVLFAGRVVRFEDDGVAARGRRSHCPARG